MKSKYLVFSSLVLVSCLFSGCDMLRSLAGRPTSKDIGVLRIEIIQEETKKKVEADSLLAVQKQREDEAASAAALDTLKSLRGNVLRKASTLGVDLSGIEGHYNIILGAFKDEANAEKFASRVSDAGYRAGIIPFRNSLKAVGVGSTDDPKAIYDCLNKVRKESFCPGEVWILVKE